MRRRPGFTGGALDRADRLRGDADAIARLAADPRARLLLLDALDPMLGHDGRLAWSSMADLPRDAEPVLLGIDGDCPHFSCVTPGMRPV